MKKITYICALIVCCAAMAGCMLVNTEISETGIPEKPENTVASAVPEAAETTAVTTTMLPAFGEKELKAQREQAKENGTLTVIIDPGHGIADPGAMHDENLGDVTEAQLTLSIAQKLSDVLIGRGYTVIMTHDGVNKPDTEHDDGKAVFGPSERCSFANAQESNLFVSLHCDAFPSSEDVYGTRIYYPVDTPYSTKLDKQFAKACAKAIESAFPDDKDVSLMDMHGQDCYTVLYKTRVPSILVECGFITNKSDAEKLLDTEWQDKFASALADGIDKYFE